MEDFKPQLNFIPLSFQVQGGRFNNIIPGPKGSAVKGSLYSPNYIKDKAGWSLNEDGSIDCRELRIGTKFVSVNPGEDINAAISKVYSAGGGTVYLASGTHTLTANLVMYEGVNLVGQSYLNTTLVMGSYQILVQGSNAYTTGTVTATYGSTTIEGAGGVTWTGKAGQSMLLDGFWYTIDSITDADTLELTTAYGGQALSGAPYAIADIIRDVMIEEITIYASTTSALKAMYFRDLRLQSCSFLSNSVSLDCDYGYSVIIKNNYGYYATGISFTFDNCGAVVLQESSIVGSGSHGMTFNTCTNSVVQNCVVQANTGDGINLTSCTAMGFMGNTCSRNGSQGIELVSGNSGLSIIHTGCFNNTSDGIKLTGTDDNNVISSCILQSNGGYGINIAAATCDNNNIRGDSYFSNSSGTYSNSGTGTYTDSGLAIPSYSAGDVLVISSDTERTDGLSVYVKHKEININGQGTLRIKFDLKQVAGNTGYGRIYKNDVAFGTEQSEAAGGSYVTKSEDLAVSNGDKIQLYIKVAAGGGDVYIQNFRIYATESNLTAVTYDA